MINFKKILFSLVICVLIITKLHAPEVQVNALWDAIENEDISTVSNIIRRNRNILNTIDEMGNSVLHVAVMQNNPAIVQLILSRNNNLVRSRGMLGETPLVLALRQYNDLPASQEETRNNLRSIIFSLIDHGADPSVEAINVRGNRVIPAHDLVPELREMILARAANR